MSTLRETCYRCTYSASSRERRPTLVRAWDARSAAALFLECLGEDRDVEGTVRVMSPGGHVDLVERLDKAS